MIGRRWSVIGAALIAACAIASGAAQQQQPQQQQQQRQRPTRDTSAQQPAPAATTPAPTGRITGRVLAGDNGRPVKRARVFITAAELPGGRAMMTDDAGAFDFSQLPAGRYTVNASKNGFITLSFGQRRPLQAGTPITLLNGQQLKGVDFQLPRGGVISGRVSDESGDAMPGVIVSVQRYQYQQGDRRLTPAGTGQTDDRGVYRVWGLNPGDYYISAVDRTNALGAATAIVANITDALASAGGADILGAIAGRGGLGAQAGQGGRGGRGGGQGGRGGGIGALLGGQDDQESLTYAPTYYPGVGSAADARPVTVGISQEVGDIDFSLSLVRTSRISGHMENPDGSWVSNGNINLTPEAAASARGNLGQNFSGRVGRDGQFSIGNVPPGRYTLRARNNDRDAAPLSAAQPLSVNGADISDVAVILAPGGSLSGTIAFQPGSTAAPDMTQVRIVAPSTEPDDAGPNPNARVNKDGSFTLDGVSQGTHLVRSNGNMRGWTLKSVTVDGRDITDTPIAVKSNQKIGNVTVTFTDKVNEISGSVTDVQGNPVTEYTVLAFATNNAVWNPRSRQIATTRPDQTGMYKIRNLPQGEYFIVTVDPSEQGEWFDPVYLEQHRGGATRLSLGEGDVKTQDFRVTR